MTDAHKLEAQETMSSAINIHSVIFVAEQYHPIDLKRLDVDDNWLYRILDNNDFNLKNAYKQLIDILEWRQKNGVNGE